MLIPDSIPEKEPILRVGMILPEDLEKSLILDVSQAKEIDLIADGNIIAYEPRDYFEIRADSGKLKFQGYSVDQLIIEQNEQDSIIIVKDVIAGRGFHWSKKIDVKLAYRLIISVVNSNILLINELPLEEYLACVATSEMSSECPDTYIEAQSIVARSWMLANVEQKHVALGFDVCNDDCCQRFQGVNNLTEHSRKAARATRGKVLMYNNKIVDARYSKSCGGVMERFENLWENDPKDYMLNIPDAPGNIIVDLTSETDFKDWVLSVPVSFCSPHFIKEEELHKYLGNVDESGKYFRWKVAVSQEELVQNLNEKLRLKIKAVEVLKPLKRAGSGRLLELEISYIDVDDKKKKLIIFKDYEIRKVLHRKFLYSSAIIIEHLLNDGEDFLSGFIYHGAGWGHGAGMCQIGGLGMALAGYQTEGILYHYYPGSELNSVYK